MASRTTKKSAASADRTKALREAGLRTTAPRRAVLGVLERAKSPLSHGDVADLLEGEALDRATVYRNLIALTEAGLVRRTDLGDHVWRFELVREYTAHETAHPHFVCTDCGTVSCMPGVTVRIDGDGAASVARHGFEVHLRGVCGDCHTPRLRRRQG
jgi:Fur family transcriptional regulator, ferric uptake regulator